VPDLPADADPIRAELARLIEAAGGVSAVARRAGVSRPDLSSYLRGVKTTITVQTAHRVAIALDKRLGLID